MGHADYAAMYRDAFDAAVSQRDQIREEIEYLKTRRALVEEAARTLEPLIYPDEYPTQEAASSPMINVDDLAPSTELDPLPPPALDQELAQRPVAAITQVYVRGEGESTNEIQRRIDIALGRAAAD